MTATPDDADETRPDPESVDAAFEAIVSRLNAPDAGSGPGPWPDAEDVSDETAREARPAPPPAPSPQRDWAEWDDLRIPPTTAEESADEDVDDGADEGHYVPPEPAPAPRGDARLRWAWAGAIGAPVMAIVLPLLGWGLDGLTGAALVVAFLLGFGYLISRLREGPRVDDGPDDGAVV